MSICAETQGSFELGTGSGEPNENRGFARLILAGYTSQSSASADEKDAHSMGFLYSLVYPNSPEDHAISKMQPDWRKLVTIIQKCKYEIPTASANNVINKDGGNAYNASFVRAKIGELE